MRKVTAGLFHSIINLMPPHKHYFELCLGSGQIARLKKPAYTNIGVEIDLKTILKYQNSYPPGMAVKNDCVINWLNTNKDLLNSIDDLIYVDPPYRLGSRRSGKPIYKYEMTDDDHRKFLTLITSLKCNVIISHYPDPMYDEYLKGWNVKKCNVSTHQGAAVEAIYYNFKTPVILHEYTYIGDNKTERQRIKRKLSRLQKKLEELPEVETNAIISFLKGRYN